MDRRRSARGFSTSGSLLIIFFGLFLALGTLYTVTSNTTERVVDAYDEELSHQNAIERTGITISEATWHRTNGTNLAADGNLTVRAENDGTTTLTVDWTDVLVDGEYWNPDEFEINTVDGQETAVWDLGEQLRLENDTTQPARVKVVTETGVAAAEPVTVAGIEYNDDAISKDNTSDGNLKNEAIEFNVTSSYDENVTLRSVTVENVTGTSSNVTHINYTNNPNEEVYLGTEPDLTSSETTASGNFSLGDTIVTDESVVLEPDELAQYTIGAFRNATGDVVSMVGATVTASITYDDPNGVERTFRFRMEVDS